MDIRYEPAPELLTEEALQQRVEQAVELFMEGYGCCQSVFAAFAPLYGVDE